MIYSVVQLLGVEVEEGVGLQQLDLVVGEGAVELMKMDAQQEEVEIQ